MIYSLVLMLLEAKFWTFLSNIYYLWRTKFSLRCDRINTTFPIIGKWMWKAGSCGPFSLHRPICKTLFCDCFWIGVLNGHVGMFEGSLTPWNVIVGDELISFISPVTKYSIVRFSVSLGTRPYRSIHESKTFSPVGAKSSRLVIIIHHVGLFT